MITITTSNSMRVKPVLLRVLFLVMCVLSAVGI